MLQSQVKRPAGLLGLWAGVLSVLRPAGRDPFIKLNQFHPPEGTHRMICQANHGRRTLPRWFNAGGAALVRDGGNGDEGRLRSEAELYIQMKTLVIGLGNPILGDDGVGWRVAEEIKAQLTSPSPPSPLPVGEGCRRRGEGNIVDVDCLSLGGISLMERLIGYERAILIDAFISEQELGSITVSKLRDLRNFSAFHITSVHGTSLQNAIELGISLGAKLPDDVTVVGISAKYVYDFSEELSQPVSKSVSKATEIVINLL